MLHEKLNNPNLDFRITGGKGNQTICEMYLMPVDHKFLKEYFMPNRYLLNSNLPELYEFNGTDLADMTNQSSGMDFNFVTRGATKTLGFISYKSKATKNGMEYDYEIEIISDNLNKHKYWELIRAANRPIMVFARISNDYGILLGDYDGAPILSSDFQMGGRKKRNEFNIVLNWTASHPAFVTKVPPPPQGRIINEMHLVPGQDINVVLNRLKQAFGLSALPLNWNLVNNILYFDNENYTIINDAFFLHDVQFTKFISAANNIGNTAFYNRHLCEYLEFTHLIELTSNVTFDAMNSLKYFIAKNLTALSGTEVFNDCMNLEYIRLDSLSSGILGSSYPGLDNIFFSVVGKNIELHTKESNFQGVPDLDWDQLINNNNVNIIFT
jgi:hypothetical protein